MPKSDLSSNIESSLTQLKESLSKAQKLSASRAGEVSEHSVDFLLSAKK